LIKVKVFLLGSWYLVPTSQQENLPMKRKIIKIDEALCNGCGNCITGCSEGALALVDGKAKLVKENFCDGFGDCIGNCPTGALTIEEREADDFDAGAVKEYLLETQGSAAVHQMQAAQTRHEQLHSGCPGMRELIFEEKFAKPEPEKSSVNQPSELRQWPVHFRLVQPGMPAFQNKELVLMSTCGPLAMANVHLFYLKNRSVIVACPKLDDTSDYISKLSAILRQANPPKIIIARMEVPCCGGLTRIVQAAVSQSGCEHIVIEENIIGVDGNIKAINLL
jgi:ferredoxin